jgi:hypothetical protein
VAGLVAAPPVPPAWVLAPAALAALWRWCFFLVLLGEGVGLADGLVVGLAGVVVVVVLA